MLVVVAYEGNGRWRCLCDCGSTTTTTAAKLNRGQKACRCILGKTWSIHGDARHNARTPEYITWLNMNQRCVDVNHHKYYLYGGRGIKVCPTWRSSYEAFLGDMGPKPSPLHTLDRKNTNGNYEPANCRWATAKEQNRNRRNNHLLTIDGVTKCITEWAEVYDLCPKLVAGRIRRGWQVPDIFRPIGLSKGDS